MKYSNGKEQVDIATVRADAVRMGVCPVRTTSHAIRRDLKHNRIRCKMPDSGFGIPAWVVPCRQGEVTAHSGDIILRHNDGSYTVMGEIQFNEYWDVAE